ncbi:sugar phosphate isomerase/epimerase family protein [Arthrobacter sp. H14]|uniref:sugar phosphate isomerase/epimerase family protein n=1 Tax=Arthrobacter sp. H14 TaxID=1312959 RepID=UPI00047A78F4|nr:sugar phosphate isomerase/epimerase [Arthrobacter sp. H14]
MNNPHTKRRIGLAQLSLLDTSPPELVATAADAGFDFIGVRVRPVTTRERSYNLAPGSPLLAETRQRMADTGIEVMDIEFLLLDGYAGPQEWGPMLEAGAELGARYMTVAAADPDRHRLLDTLAALTEDAACHGIIPTLEPISYQQVASLPAATGMAEQAGCSVLLDALHFARFGGTLDQVRSAAGYIPMLQLCDGPGVPPPDREALIFESRSNRRIPGDGDFPLAALAAALDPSLPVSVEVAADSLKADLGPSEFARQLKTAADDVLLAAAGLQRQEKTGIEWKP